MQAFGKETKPDFLLKNLALAQSGAFYLEEGFAKPERSS